MPTRDVLYMGDTSIETAASYLSLILEHSGLSYDYVPSELGVSDRLLANDYRLYILSDYPAARIGIPAMRKVEARTHAGAAVLMIGGWESFQGQSGGYHDSPLAEVLPVHISPKDDRMNSADPCFVVQEKSHSITDGLPLERPPLVAGYNRFTHREEAEVIMSVVRCSSSVGSGKDGKVQIMETARDPFLVLGSWGGGRTAALATDLAPHWVGGFVDWGDARVSLSGPGREIEVGNWYLRFVKQLLTWCLQPEGSQPE